MPDFTRVSSDVLFADCVSLESLVAVRAKVRPGIAVAGHVAIECSFSTESALAFRAREHWHVAAIVGQLVSPQHTFRNEAPAIFDSSG